MNEKNEIMLNITETQEVVKYELLHTLEFNSTRKRMSVILRASDGKIILYCKGADSILYARMKENG
jgi:magnesium-transporting ATPase (P-type)